VRAFQCPSWTSNIRALSETSVVDCPRFSTHLVGKPGRRRRSQRIATLVRAPKDSLTLVMVSSST